MLHFLLAGSLLFVAHRLVVGDSRTIAVTPGVRADVGRRLRDHSGRAPSSAEMAKAISEWKRDEALYREALREHLDREDGTVRSVLADKMRARAALAVPKRKPPSDAELAQWLAAHRSLYELPLRYEFDSIAFGEPGHDAQSELERCLHALSSGADAAALGRPIVSGKLTADELATRLGSDVAQRISAAPFGRWESFTAENAVMLVRVNRVDGGLPSFDELRPRLIIDASYAAEQEAIEREVSRVVDRFRFEERP
jgi:hypothetical protein